MAKRWITNLNSLKVLSYTVIGSCQNNVTQLFRQQSIENKYDKCTNIWWLTDDNVSRVCSTAGPERYPTNWTGSNRNKNKGGNEYP